MGNLSAIRDPEPETGSDDDYAEVGRKRASRKFGGLVTVSRLVASDLRTCLRFWADDAQTGSYIVGQTTEIDLGGRR